MTAITVDALLEDLAEIDTAIPPTWGPDTTLVEVRETCGELAVALLVAHVERATSDHGPWPMELLEACDTLGMLADFAAVRT